MHDPKRNRILASLRGSDFSRLAADLELVTLDHGHALQDGGKAAAFVYFPTTCIASLGARTRNGDATALAMIGGEGVICASPTRGRAETISHVYLVTGAGHAFRLDSEVFRWELDQGGRTAATGTAIHPRR